MRTTEEGSQQEGQMCNRCHPYRAQQHDNNNTNNVSDIYLKIWAIRASVNPRACEKP